MTFSRVVHILKRKFSAMNDLEMQRAGAHADEDAALLDRAAAAWRKGASSVPSHRLSDLQKSNEMAPLSFGSFGSTLAFNAIKPPTDFDTDSSGKDCSKSDALDMYQRQTAKSQPQPPPPKKAEFPVPKKQERPPSDGWGPNKRRKKQVRSEESWQAGNDEEEESSPGASAYGASESSSASASGSGAAAEANTESLRNEEAAADHANMLEELRQIRQDLPGGEQLASLLEEAFADDRSAAAQASTVEIRPPGRISVAQPRGPVSVPHANVSAAAASSIDWSGKKYLSLQRVQELNFKLAHGINFTDRDRIDLEHTSCESSSESEREDAPAVIRGAPAFRAPDGHQSSDLDSEAVALERARALFPSDSRSLSTGGKLTYDADADAYYQAGPNDDDDDADADDKMSSSRRKRKRFSPARGLRQSTLSGGFVPDRDGGDDGGGSSFNSGSAHKKTAGVASTVGRMNSCFLCRWGKHEHDVVNNEHMESLLRMIYENIGEIPPEYIALAVHKFYMCVLRPAAIRAGQQLPVWRSRDIFICITTHNQDPQMRLARDLQKLEVVQQAIEGHIFYQQMPPPPPADGNQQSPAEAALGLPAPPPGPSAEQVAAALEQSPRYEVNLKAVQALQGIMRMKYLIAGIKLPAMAFFQARRDIKLGADRQYFKGIALKDGKSRRKAASRLRK